MLVEDEKSLTLADFLKIVRLSVQRYWRPAVVAFVLIWMLVSLLAVRLPDLYESRAVIFIQPQRLTSSILDNPQKEEMDEKMEALVQEILSRARLRAIVDQYKLYPELVGGEVGKTLAINKLRDDIVIDTVKTPAGKQLLQTFSLTYFNTDPRLAFQVTKALANLFIEESIIARRSEVQGTQEFLEGQLVEARKKLEVTEKKVQEFTKANYGRLPEHLDQAVARLQNYQSQLATNSQLLAANMQRRSYLQEDLARAQRSGAANVAAGNGQFVSTDPRANLAQLESALAILLSKYSERHPDVVATRQRIQMLKQKIASGDLSVSRVRSGGTGFDPASRTLRDDLNKVEIEITRLQKENDSLRANIQQLEQDVAKMPEQEQELVQIRRDYTNVKDSYDRLLKARDEAALQSSLVKSQKGAQFRLVEDPEIPYIPSGPNRWLIGIAGFVGALVVAMLVPFIAYFLNGAYKFRNELETELGVEVIGLMPPMQTPALMRRKAAADFAAALVLVVSLFAGSAVIFFVV